MVIAYTNSMFNETNNKGENKMPKLTEADLALLKSRGKVTSLTTIRSNGDDLSPSYNKVKKVKKAKKANTKHPLVGRKLHTSFGYDMTINNFAQILEVSPTGKTVVCQMVSKNTNGMEWGYDGTGKACFCEWSFRRWGVAKEFKIYCRILSQTFDFTYFESRTEKYP